MSTTIATGFRIDHCDLGALHEAVSELRATIVPLAKKAHASLVAARTCSLVDRALARGAEWPANPLGSVWGDVDDASRSIGTTGMRDPSCDFGFEISFIPDPTTSSIYGLLHCEHEAWRRAWMRRREVSDFRWWNGSDQPSGIRSSEWARRGETWDRIMPTMVPSAHGFSALVNPVRLVHTLPNPMRHQPSLADRKREVAADLLMSRYAVEDAEEGEDVFAMVMKASRRARSEKGRTEAAAIAADLRLPRRITMEMALSRTIPEGMDLA